MTCTDNIDNDGDGFTDCQDFDCNVPECGDPEDTPERCSDGYDNDGNGFADCLDFTCESFSVCSNIEASVAACTDGVDNDNDGGTDCADGACAQFAVCQTNEDNTATCSDGVDNDDDGQTDCNDSACAALAVCGAEVFRVASWNIEVVDDDQSSNDVAAALDVLARIDADVVCLQEVSTTETDAFFQLATNAGYDHAFLGSRHGLLGGSLKNGCFSRFPFDTTRSLHSEDLSPDPDANDVGRDILELRVEVVPGVSFVGVFVVHLKSGPFVDEDVFRRGVEAVRLQQAVEAYRVTHPGDPIIVMGDFNEEVGDSTIGDTYNAVPNDIAGSFELGSDISLPLIYDPFAILDIGFTDSVPTLEDSNDTGTRIPTDRRIDYVLHDGLTLVGQEVYDACRDNGVDDGAAGGLLEKSGEPLACDRVANASDHRPVVLEFASP